MCDVYVCVCVCVCVCVICMCVCVIMQENRKINFVKYGKPNGHSAMAACVGKPAAIAARMLLSGSYSRYACEN